MSTSLTLVPLGNDLIQAVQQDGHVWAALKGMCASLSLDYSAQLKRLKASRWGVMAVIATTAADGKSYQTTTLRADKIPMWLVTVERSRVKDVAVREKIDRFQDEAADVLARHFAPSTAPHPTPPETDTAKAIAELRAQIQGMLGVLAPLMAEVHALAAPVPHDRVTTIRDQCRHWGWEYPTEQHQTEIRNRAYELHFGKYRQLPAKVWGRCLWVGDEQIALLNQAIVDVRTRYDRQEARRAGVCLPGME